MALFLAALLSAAASQFSGTAIA
ncbi:MAG: hypothetical protein H6Q82_1943, partial [Deltaproteobacteria bacterium]|nr:hypothetical protein [Deltaproteobacteria bacterium]